MREIYLDNSATTRAMPEVRDAVVNALTEEYGNPSSLHGKGVAAERLVRTAREQIASTLRVSEKEILFTSGGTESNNLALSGVMEAGRRRGRHLITTKIEHPSVAKTAEWLAEQGAEVTWLPVDSHGRISPDELEAAIRPDTILVSVMMVNNEIGTIEPVEEIGERIHRTHPDVLFHVDAVQAYGKLPIRPRKAKIDLLSVSGHKIHGPKGIGFLYVREGVRIHPILFGGGQQRDLRSGTENVPGIVGLGTAAELICRDLDEHASGMYRLQEQLIEGLKKIPDVTINGPEGSERAPQVISASFGGLRSEVLLHALEAEGICVSSGSACSSNGQKHPSATLTAIHLDRKRQEGTIRFSLGIYNTEDDIRDTLCVLEEIVPKLRRYARR